MKNMTVEPIRQKTVVAQVMEKIKDLIVSGQYKTGDKFPTEAELAEMFKIGRSSIREALKIFQHLGVLESRVPRGTFVCDSSNISKEALTWSILLGNNDFYDLLEFRMIMEQQGLWHILVFRKDDENFKQQVIDKLQNEVNIMTRAVEHNDFDRRIDADYRFHQHLIEACGNEIFNSVYQTLDIFLREEMTNAAKAGNYTLNSPERHQFLIDKIIEGDILKASDAFRTHIHNVDHILQRKKVI